MIRAGRVTPARSSFPDLMKKIKTLFFLTLVFAVDHRGFPTFNSELLTVNSRVVCFAPPLHWKPGMHIPKSHPRAMAWRGAPGRALGLTGTTGTKKIAVILINFTTMGFGSNATQTGLTAADFQGTDLTEMRDTYFANFKSYYTEASYSQLSLNISYVGSNGVFSDPTLVTPYTASGSMSSYGGNNDANAGELIREAILAATANGVTSTNYDGVIVWHAGYGNESSASRTGSASNGDNGDIWSLVANFAVANGFTDGACLPAREAKVSGGSVSAVQILPVTGVLCHEFGHLLGLPDLYDTSSGRSKWVGKWDLMDFGTWNGTTSGGRPGHYSAWSKVLLGWITPTKLTSSTSISVNALASSGTSSVYRMDVPGSTQEYFLIEYRRLTGFDDALPGAGMLIWHVDDSVGTFALNNVNASDSRPRLKVVEADANASIFTSSSSEAGDVFTGSSQLFTSTQSDAYSGSKTGITVSNFSGAGGSVMTALASMILASTGLEAKKAFNYPNPVRNATSTTIRLVFSRPVTSADLRIYTVAGELVRSVSLSQSDFQAAKSADLEWVYEYAWDLTNKAGQAVTTGVYIYAVEGVADTGRQAITGKLAIIK